MAEIVFHLWKCKLHAKMVLNSNTEVLVLQNAILSASSNLRHARVQSHIGMSIVAKANIMSIVAKANIMSTVAIG